MRKEFLLRRVHSIIGVVPIGIFVVQHLLINHFAVYGPASFNKAVQFMENLPFLLALEIFLIYIPITYHAILGIYLAFQSKNNMTNYSYIRNWLFFFQRVTGLITFVFIGLHVWQTRIQVALGSSEVNYEMMQMILQKPIYFIIYLIGVVSTVFHLANGLWSFFVTWGITQSRQSQQVMTYVTILIFLIVSFIGVRALCSFV